MKTNHLLGMLVLLFPTIVFSQEIAVCHSPKGRAYYANIGLVRANEAGWRDDEISGGRFTLTKQGNDFDLLYFDIVTKSVVSSKGDGATVVPLRDGVNNFTILVYYPNNTIELYSFMRENSGALSLHLIQSKGGKTLIQKSSIMVAKCDFINFSSIK